MGAGGRVARRLQLRWTSAGLLHNDRATTRAEPSRDEPSRDEALACDCRLLTAATSARARVASQVETAAAAAAAAAAENGGCEF